MLIISILWGCSDSPTVNTDPSRAEKNSKETELEGLQPSDAARELSSEGKRFLSWNGVWKGSDIDTELLFHPDGTVEITHYGSGADSTTGSYKTDDETVTISAAWDELVEMPGHTDWPELQMRHDDKHQYLFPARSTDTLQYGDQSAWPLKQIDLKTDSSS